jgi:hypothetical protein
MRVYPAHFFLVFAISLLTTLGYREVYRGKGTFDEQTAQRSASSSDGTAPTFESLSFAKPHTVTSRGVIVDVSWFTSSQISWLNIRHHAQRTMDMSGSVDFASKTTYHVDSEDASISDRVRLCTYFA